MTIFPVWLNDFFILSPPLRFEYVTGGGLAPCAVAGCMAPCCCPTNTTLAVGPLFDVNKSIKPFKTGVFIGADRYSKLKGEKVQGSGKLWIALQIGYDFTE
jgi:hypothetical protein